MKEKLMKALQLASSQKLQQQAAVAQAHAITIVWTKAGFEKEMARRRYNR